MSIKNEIPDPTQEIDDSVLDIQPEGSDPLADVAPEGVPVVAQPTPDPLGGSLLDTAIGLSQPQDPNAMFGDEADLTLEQQVDMMEPGGYPDIEKNILGVHNSLSPDQRRIMKSYAVQQSEEGINIDDAVQRGWRDPASTEELVRRSYGGGPEAEEAWYTLIDEDRMSVTEFLMHPKTPGIVGEEFGHAAGFVINVGQNTVENLRLLNNVPVLGDFTGGVMVGFMETAQTANLIMDAAFDTGHFYYDTRALAWGPEGKDVNFSRELLRGFSQYALPYGMAAKGLRATGAVSAIKGGIVQGTKKAARDRRFYAHLFEAGLGGVVADFVATNPTDGDGLTLMIAEQFGLDTSAVKDLIGVSGESGNSGQMLFDKFLLSLQGIADGLIIDGALKGLGQTAKGATKGGKWVFDKKLGGEKRAAEAQREVMAAVLARNTRSNQLRKMGFLSREIETRLEEEGLGLGRLKDKYVIRAYAELAAPAFNSTPEQIENVLKRKIRSKAGYNMNQLAIDTDGGTFAAITAAPAERRGTRADLSIERVPMTRIPMTEVEGEFFQGVFFDEAKRAEWEAAGIFVRTSPSTGRSHIEVHGDMRELDKAMDEIGAWHASEAAAGGNPNPLPPAFRKGVFGYESHRMLFQHGNQTEFEFTESALSVKADEDEALRLAKKLRDQQISEAALPDEIMAGRRADAIGKGRSNGVDIQRRTIEIRDRLLNEREDMFAAGAIDDAPTEALADKLGRAWAEGTEVREDLNGDIVRFLKQQPDGNKYLDKKGGIATKNAAYKQLEKRAKAWRERYVMLATMDRTPGHPDVGAPPYIHGQAWAGPASRQQLVDDLVLMAGEGKAARHWYEESSAEILVQSGGNKRDAEIFAQLVAITSAQNELKPNIELATTIFNAWKFGDPKLEADNGHYWVEGREDAVWGKTRDQDKNIHNLLKKEEAWEGRKTNSFYLNLMLLIDPDVVKNTPDMATVDIHMMRAMGFPTEVPTGLQYNFGESVLREVADKMNKMGFAADEVTPYQVQAMAWTSQKWRRETVRPLHDKGVLGPFELPGTTNYANLMQEQMALSTYESVPHPSGQTLNGLEGASWGVRELYTQDIEEAFNDENGINMLLDILGLPQGRMHEGNGVYNGQTNPARQSGINLGRERRTSDARSSAKESRNRAVAKGDERLVTAADHEIDRWYAQADPNSKRQLGLKLRVMQYVQRQGSMSWHKPFYLNEKELSAFQKSLAGGRGKGAAATLAANGMDVEGLRFNNSAAGGVDVIVRGLKKRFGDDLGDDFLILDTESGMRVINYSETVDNLDFLKAVKEILDHGEGTNWKRSHDSQFRGFKSDHEYLGGLKQGEGKFDWAADPEGRSLLAHIRERGEPALVDYVDNILGPRIQAVNEHYARTHRVGDAGRFTNSSGERITADTEWWDATGRAQRGTEAGPTLVGAGANRGDVAGRAAGAAGVVPARPLAQARAVGGQRQLLADAGLLPERMYHVSNGDRTVSGLTQDKAGSGFLKRDDAEGIFLYSPGHRMEPDVNSHYGPDAVHHEIDVSDLEIAVIGVKGVEDPRLKEMEALRLDNPDATDADLAKLVRIDGVHDVAGGITTLFRDVEPGRVKAVNPEKVPGSTLPPQMPMRGESNAVHDVTAVTAARDGVRNGMETDAGQTLHLQDPGPLGPKGWAEVDAASGFTFIGALDGADISTFAHEMSHSMHGQLIARGDPKMMQRLADAFGVEDYRHWDADSMEAFAEGFEQWVMDPARLPQAKRDGIAYIGAVMRDIYRKMPEEARPREMTQEVRDVMDALLQRTDLPIRYAPGKYMPSISWAAIHEEVKIRIAKNEGMPIEDLLEPGTIIATLRGNLRKQMDPNRPETAGPDFEDLDLTEPDDFLRAIAAFDDLMQSMQDSDIVGFPRDMDDIKADARDQFLNWMAAGDDDMREAIANLMVSDARAPGQAARNVIAMNMLMRHQGEKLLKLRDIADADPSTVNYAQLDKTWLQMQFLRSQFLLLRYQSGSGLGAWRADMEIPSYASLRDRRKAMEWMESMGRGERTGKDLVAHLRGLDIDDSRTIADQLGRHEKGLATRLKEMAFEKYTAGLLSSMRTFIGIASLSPLAFQGLEGAGKAIGGLTMKGQRTRAMMSVARNAVNNFKNTGQAIKYALRAFATEQPQFLSRQLLDTSYDHRAIRADNGPHWVTALFDAVGQRDRTGASKWHGGSQGHLNPVNLAGRGIRLPQTFIMSIDEFAKQVFGRTALEAEIRTRVVSDMIAQARKSDPDVPNRPMSYAEEKAFLKANKETLDMKVRDEMKASMSEGRLRTTRVRMDQLMKSDAFTAEQSWTNRAKMITDELTSAEAGARSGEINRAKERSLRPVFQGDLPVPMQHFMKFMDSFAGGAPRVLLMPFIRTPYKIMEVFMQYEPVTLTYAQASSRTKNFFGTKLETKEGKAPRTVFKKRWQRQPNSELGAIHRKTMEDLNSNDPLRVAEARGRIMMAWGLTGLGVALAMNEEEGVHTTGSGPSGPHGARLRKNVLGPDGWQSDSLVFPQDDGTKRYYQYSKMDPIGLHLSLCANIVELFQAEPDGDEAEKVSMFTSIAYSAMNTLLDRSYLKGTSDFIKMLTTSDETLEKWAIRQMARFATGYSILGQDISRTIDPAQREAQTLIDEVRMNSWIGEQLLGPAPPKFNMLGEVVYDTEPGSHVYLNRINPMRVSEDSGDPVTTELARCRYGWTPPSSIQFKHDLTTFPGPEGAFNHGSDPTAWTYYQHQLGTARIDGSAFGLQRGRTYNMREALAELIVEGGEAYERLYAHLSYEPDPEKDNRSQRVQLIQNVMSAYRERAKSRMLIACPEVRAGIARMKQKSLMIKRETAQNLGAMDMVRQLEGQMDAWKEFENDQDGSGDMFQDLLEDASPEQRQQLEGAFPQ